MTLVKIAAHFILTPRAGLCQWPVLSLQKNGSIIGFTTHPEGLREQPSLQFFGGILVPGFIDKANHISTTPLSNSRIILNNHFANGTLILTTHHSEEPLINHPYPPYIIRQNAKQKRKNINLPDATTNSKPIWEKLNEQAINDPEHDLEKLLYSATSDAAYAFGIDKAGAFIPGYFPGILLIQQANLQKMKLTPHSTVKWLSVPENYF